MVLRGGARAPGTCGELAQGLLGDVAAMVTCPIDRYSRAFVELAPGRGDVKGPLAAGKASLAVERTLASLDRTDLDATLKLRSDIRRGKGMGSSTADVLAATGATHAALEIDASPLMLARVALSIEPTDGVMYPGIALFDHVEGRLARTLGSPPLMRVLALEFAGSVDTTAFHQVQSARGRCAPALNESLALIEAGLLQQDPRLIGRGATLSAELHQGALHKSQLEAALKLGQQAGAVGVNVAHSGTVMGLLFEDDAQRLEWAARAAGVRLSGLAAVHRHRVIGGGVTQQRVTDAWPA